MPKGVNIANTIPEYHPNNGDIVGNRDLINSHKRLILGEIPEKGRRYKTLNLVFGIPCIISIQV